MKRIGIIGGISYRSDLYYYEQINYRLGNLSSDFTYADLILRGMNPASFQGSSSEITDASFRICDEVDALVSYSPSRDDCDPWGCDYVAIASDTMHSSAYEVLRTMIEAYRRCSKKYGIDRIRRPTFVHIGDCIAEKCQEISARYILVLGTKYTMTESFMRDRLRTHGLSPVSTYFYKAEAERIDEIIYNELYYGIVTPESKNYIVNFINGYPCCDIEEQPDAVVLGSTLLNMIVEPGDVDIPLIDSADAHVDKLVKLCLDN